MFRNSLAIMYSLVQFTKKFAPF